MTQDSRQLIRLSATITETDMSSFEGGLDEKWCHRKGRPCGSPPNTNGPRPHFGETINGRCNGCGKLVCPDCEFAWKESRRV